MAVFEYQVLSVEGKLKTGELSAETIRQARDQLREDGLRIVNVQPQSERRGLGRLFAPSKTFRSRHTLPVAMATRQFATLVQSGLPLVDALEALEKQIEHPHLSRAFQDIREQVTSGTTLADAMAMHPTFFSTLYVSMIRAGEASGTLAEVLDRMAQYLKSTSRLKNRVMAALIYPFIVMCLGFVVVTVLVIYVVPKIRDVLESQGTELPMATRLLIQINEWTRAYWWLGIAGIVGLLLCYRMIMRTTRGRMMRDRLFLALPIFGSLAKKQAVSRFLLSLATLLRGGIQLADALRVVKDVIGNMMLAREVEYIIDRILGGSDFGTPLKKSRFFPPTVGYMAAIGEESGRLEDMLDKVSELYEEEIEIATQKLTSVLEPATILALTAVVAFIVLAIMLPIMRMSQGIS